MAEVEAKPVETETPAPPATPPQEPPPPQPETLETPAPLDMAEEKAVVPPPLPAEEAHVSQEQTLAVVEKIPEATAEEKPLEKKPSEDSLDRDAQLARVETEKKMSLIKAWEESEKCKAENKAQKKVASVEAWENSKKASIEAELKMIEEKLEKKKAEYAEAMKNKVAMIHKEAEERKAMIEGKRGEELLKAEEMAAKYRAIGKPPKKLLGLF